MLYVGCEVPTGTTAEEMTLDLARLAEAVQAGVVVRWNGRWVAARYGEPASAILKHWQLDRHERRWHDADDGTPILLS